MRSVDTLSLGVLSARRASEIGLFPSRSPLLLFVAKHSWHKNVLCNYSIFLERGVSLILPMCIQNCTIASQGLVCPSGAPHSWVESLANKIGGGTGICTIAHETTYMNEVKKMRTMC